MRIKKFRYFMCDFETTVYDGQEFTEVWLSGCVELFTEDIHIFQSLTGLFDYVKSLKCNVVLYFHNLKFDGAFWLSYLICDLGYRQAVYPKSAKEYDLGWYKERDMQNKTFKYSISTKGMFYNIIIKDNYFIEIRDSLKLLPFSVENIGKSFGTKHRKLEMEYEGFRYAGCNVTEEEKEYFKNDLLVPKEALELMFNDGYTSLTIGSCCLKKFKEMFNKSKLHTFEYDETFPNLTLIDIDKEKYGSKNADEYIRKSYRGGWTYLVKGKENKIYKNGCTADVNSLYPSMFHSKSGNVYPFGRPCFWKGNYIDEKAKNKYYFVRIRTRFKIKDGFLPTIQIKNNPMYRSTEFLETSDIYDPEINDYVSHYSVNGEIISTRVTLTLTCVDYELFLKHYNVYDFEILDGCWFYTYIGFFDEYINEFMEIKENNTGAKREEAKLFMNNLYGKFGSNDDSSFKFAIEKEDGSIGFIPIKENDKKPGYIPVASANTSYARRFTITHAQINYYGPDNPGFIYADTDSIHCDLDKDQLISIDVHPTHLCCWKIEMEWEDAIFVRQKTYIERNEKKTLIKCAGMGKRCKNLLEVSLLGEEHLPSLKKLTEEEQEFLYNKDGSFHKRTLEDFGIGLSIPSKLVPKRIPGGIVLNNTTYKIR